VATAGLDFRVLGPLEVIADGAPLHIDGRRLRALLAVLLLNANRPVTPDRLIDDIWGERPPATATNALHVHISRLRQAIGSGAVVHHRAGYTLSLARSQLDLNRFEDAWRDARRTMAAGDHRAAHSALCEALRLWRGDPLVEFAGSRFADADAHRLAEMRWAAVGDRIEVELALGRHEEAVPELEAMVELHPLQERPLAQLMVALYRCGRQVDALAACRDARERYATEFGLTLGPDVLRIERAILQHDPTLAAPTDRGPDRGAASVAVAARSIDELTALVSVAGPMGPATGGELLLVRTIDPGDPELLETSASETAQQVQALHHSRINARAATFTSETPASDLVKLADEQGSGLLLIDAGWLVVRQQVLEDASCDVAVVSTRPGWRAAARSPVVVPFGGNEHDWAALEIGCWLAHAVSVPLLLAGVAGRRTGRADASRTLTAASLVAQRVYGVLPEPRLVPSAPEGLVELASAARALVMGFSHDWHRAGLGPVRDRVAATAACPVVFVRQGRRPNGFAPAHAVTRFTWSLGDQAGQSR
jgi:DNA-binding SARP family transcriptional activator